MPARLEPYQDNPCKRAQLASFLERSFRSEGGCTVDLWQRRLSHWWDQNPFAKEIPHRGWALWKEDDLVGFLGVIPACYEDAAGMTVPALLATSWTVDEAHRNSAFAMGLQLQRLGQEFLLVDTTPSPQVQALLLRGGWQGQREVRRRFLLGSLASRSMRGSIAGLAREQRIVHSPAEVRSVGRQEGPGCLRKRLTPEYLRWYAASPMREHHFLGVVDADGCLSSYLTVTPQRVRGVPSWTVADWFTTRVDERELHALMEALARQPPRWAPLITVASFPGDPSWGRLPHIYARTEQVCHFHLPPPHLKGQPKRTVPAEGDWGL